MEATVSTKVKSLGQVLTPPTIAEFMVGWAIRTPKDKILEPSCGDGVFLRASIRELLSLGAKPEDIPNQVYGIELDKGMIEETRKKLLAEFGFVPTLINTDFFDIQPPSPQRRLIPEANRIPIVDVVIGNPPYIRYQLFKGTVRKKAIRLSSEEGVDLPELTASWVPFVIHAGKFLRTGGRLAMVLPSKLLHVNYAKPLRKWLLKNFESIIIVSFEKRAFSVLEDTVILMGVKGNTKTPKVQFVTVNSEEDLLSIDAQGGFKNYTSFSPKAEEKWTKYIIPPYLLKAYLRIMEKTRGKITTLGELGKVTIGVVTGDNRFFTLTAQEAEMWNIEEKYLFPLISRAEHIQGIKTTNNDWKLLRKLGQKCYLLYITEPWERLSQSVKDYLKIRGEELKVKERYKVRIRKRWYEVPGVRFPDLFMSYMIHDVPKVSANEIKLDNKKATSTNTIHQVFLRENVEPTVVATSFYNSLTLASFELNGRFYGGGVLKMEPKEAERVVLPDVKDNQEITSISEKVDSLIRKGKVIDAVEILNEILLEGELELHRNEIETITEVWEHLKKNRLEKSRR